MIIHMIRRYLLHELKGVRCTSTSEELDSTSVLHLHNFGIATEHLRLQYLYNREMGHNSQ